LPSTGCIPSERTRAMRRRQRVDADELHRNFHHLFDCF
jgi:hypothetical protein